MINLLVLGQLHDFTERELSQLRKRFVSIHFLKYKDINTDEVIHEIASLISKGNQTIILLNSKAKVPNKLLNYLTRLEQRYVNYLTVQSFIEKYLHKCYIPTEQRDLSFLEQTQSFSLFQYIQKRFVDYVGSLLLLLITFPIMLYSFFRIKKESPGPIFFKQTRVGINGKKFTCIKFRSMYLNSEHNPYTQKNDKRIFPWGSTMRKTRIDELPQILNILKGDMHLIGPRAEWDILVDKYEQDIPYYHERHIIRPGITGWAQVMYPYGSNCYDAKQKLMYDLYYIKYWNLWFELKVFLKTTLVIFKKSGI